MQKQYILKPRRTQKILVRCHFHMTFTRRCCRTYANDGGQDGEQQNEDYGEDDGGCQLALGQPIIFFKVLDRGACSRVHADVSLIDLHKKPCSTVRSDNNDMDRKSSQLISLSETMNVLQLVILTLLLSSSSALMIADISDALTLHGWLCAWTLMLAVENGT